MKITRFELLVISLGNAGNRTLSKRKDIMRGKDWEREITYAQEIRS